MNKMIFALIGAAIGGVTGFIVGKATSKKRYEKELKEREEAIKSTYDALLEKAKKEAEEKISELEDKTEETDAEDSDGNGKVDVIKASYEESEDEDYGYADFDDYEKELRDARAEFLKEVEQEYGERGEPYNISEEVYNEPFPGFGKGTIMIDETYDKAYDQDGIEVEDWHVVVGDSYGNLDDDRQDEYGRIFIRCPRVAMDYEVTWSRIELAH